MVTALNSTAESLQIRTDTLFGLLFMVAGSEVKSLRYVLGGMLPLEWGLAEVKMQLRMDIARSEDREIDPDGTLTDHMLSLQRNVQRLAQNSEALADFSSWLTPFTKLAAIISTRLAMRVHDEFGLMRNAVLEHDADASGDADVVLSSSEEIRRYMASLDA